MAAYVTYNGDPKTPKGYKLQVSGMQDWTVGETRLFDTSFAAGLGRTDPDDFALFFVTAQNGSRTEWLRFTLSDKDPNAKPTTAKSPEKAKE